MNLEEAKANIGAEVELDESTKPYGDTFGAFNNDFLEMIENNKTLKITGTGAKNVFITHKSSNITGDFLIEAKHLKLKPQNYKIHVPTEDESREAQELFFELGYRWSSGEQIVGYTRSPYIYSYTERINCGDLAKYFENHKNKQITLQYLRDMVAKKRMKELEEKQKVVFTPYFLEDIANATKKHPMMAKCSVGDYLTSEEGKTVETEMTWQDAFRAVADGKEVVFHNNFAQQWESINELQVSALIGSKVRFRIAPQRIILNGEYTKEELLQKIGEME